MRYCCMVEPILKKERYGNTSLILKRYECPICGRHTQGKYHVKDAEREWNNPEVVRVNSTIKAFSVI